MPRAGLTPERVVEAAAELADEIGLDQVTVSAVARGFGVKDASLYAHVRGLSDLRSRLATASAAAFADRINTALAGRSGHEALAAFAQAYRTFAVHHPGRYAATQLALPAETLEASPGHRRLVELTYALFLGYDLAEPDRTDAVRLLRSTLHGFAALEAAGGFGAPRDLDASWARMIEALHALLTRWPPAPPSATLSP
ncbi:WHG domain-containing protein [Streptomyces bambusae]|uniref:TetR/AcrR family transcriptional regulator n=1 Tax=Streptomyces bambusae TaxID=1550616 RepID=UPI001CFFB696|nr:TetR-like C-terminal domain-containing protein [Streptomyces bambusae]MCB5170112.1 WHG domain-containing protein [Streptomyces bambusae]